MPSGFAFVLCLCQTRLGLSPAQHSYAEKHELGNKGVPDSLPNKIFHTHKYNSNILEDTFHPVLEDERKKIKLLHWVDQGLHWVVFKLHCRAMPYSLYHTKAGVRSAEKIFLMRTQRKEDFLFTGLRRNGQEKYQLPYLPMYHYKNDHIFSLCLLCKSKNIINKNFKKMQWLPKVCICQEQILGYKAYLISFSVR